MNYPNLNNNNFINEISNLYEFKIKIFNKLKLNQDAILQLKSYQELLLKYISPITPYKKLLIWHSTGSGKTFTSLVICEYYRFLMKDKKCNFLILIPNKRLKKTIENILIDQFKLSINIIKNHYTIISFNLFETIDIKIYYDIVVIDEIHTLKKNNVYNKIDTFIKNKNYNKFIGLTATLIWDKIDDLNFIINLFSNENIYLDSKNYDFEILKKNMLGKISYYHSDYYNDLNIIYGGYKFLDNLYLLNLYFTEENRDIEYNINDKHNLYKKRLYFDFQFPFKNKNWVPNDNVYKNVTWKIYYNSIFKYNNEPNSLNLYVYLNKNNLSYYCPKLDFIIRNINEHNNENVFIYNNYIKGSIGIENLSIYLEILGYEKITNIYPTSINKKRFITSDNINFIKFLQYFNKENNKYGDYCKIIIGSKKIIEGLSINNIRQYYCLLGQWNYSSIVQATGRVIREKSHSFFSKEEKYIKIYYLNSYYKNYSIDKHMYDIVKEKIDDQLKILNDLKSISLENIINVTNQHKNKLNVNNYKKFYLKFFLHDCINNLKEKIKNLEIFNLKTILEIMNGEFDDHVVEESLRIICDYKLPIFYIFNIYQYNKYNSIKYLYKHNDLYYISSSELNIFTLDCLNVKKEIKYYYNLNEIYVFSVYTKILNMNFIKSYLSINNFDTQLNCVKLLIFEITFIDCFINKTKKVSKKFLNLLKKHIIIHKNYIYHNINIYSNIYNNDIKYIRLFNNFNKWEFYENNNIINFIKEKKNDVIVNNNNNNKIDDFKIYIASNKGRLCLTYTKKELLEILKDNETINKIKFYNDSDYIENSSKNIFNNNINYLFNNNFSKREICDILKKYI